MLKKLNFPEYTFRIRSDEDKFMIFDELRKKFVRLTEEEWVRQHMVRYLLTEQQIPGSLVRVETGLSYGKLNKRMDIVVYRRDGTPFMIIECKAPHIPVRQRVLLQAGIYGKTLQPAFIGITNGITHFFWAMDYDQEKTTLLDQFPVYA